MRSSRVLVFILALIWQCANRSVCSAGDSSCSLVALLAYQKVSQSRYLIVADSAPGNLILFKMDPITGAVTSSAQSASTTTSVDSVAISQDGSMAFAATQGANVVIPYSLDQDTGRITTGNSTTLTGAHVAAVDLRSRFVFVADSASTLFALSQSSLGQTGSGAVGGLPSSIALEGQGNYVYVGNNSTSFRGFSISNSGSLSQISTTSGHITSTTWMTGVSNHLYVSDATNPFKIYSIPASGVPSLVGSQNPASTVAGLASGGNGKFIVMISVAPNMIYVFARDPATGLLTQASSLTLASAPSRVVVDSAGKIAFVIPTGGATCSQFSIAADGTLTQLATFSAISAPVDAAIATFTGFLSTRW